jgi:hypothetical protein
MKRVAPFAIAVVVCLVFAWLAREQTIEVQSWPTTEGNITETRVAADDSDGVYVVHLEYEYAVAGRSYRGQEAENRDTTLDEAQHRASGFPVGSKATIHYDPKHPGTATIHPEHFTRGWMGWVLGAVFVVGLAILLQWRRRLKDRLA